MIEKARRLEADELTYVCDPGQLPFETTDELPDLMTVIGQERAVRAIDFGVQIPSYGFNIYAMGPSGTGRSTTVWKFLQRKAQEEPVPDDWCYVHNFADPRRPRAIRLPAGYGNQLRDDMAELVDDLQRAIPAALESEDHSRQVNAIVKEAGQARDEILEKLEQQVKRRGFTLVQTATGLGVAPVVDNQVLGPEQYRALDEDTRKRLDAEHPDLQQDLERAMRGLRALDKDTKERLRSLTREVADRVIGDYIDDLESQYARFESVLEYLKAVRRDIVENVADFRPEPEVEDEPESDGSEMVPPGEPLVPLERYRVNVIVDNSRTQGAPLIYETNPTYPNLVGRIEQEVRYGILTTDFTHIRAGALHRANGGYLVINAHDLLEAPLAWEALKRTVKNREIRTEVMPEVTPAIATTSLEPEAIPFRAKVILIGDWETYSVLFDMDSDFRKLFKVRADFATWMDRTPESIMQYAAFVASCVRSDGLLPFDRTAVAKIVEAGVQLVEHKERLSTRFATVVEVIQEASYWASRAGRSLVTAADVERTLEERRYRANYAQERWAKRILEGTVYILTDGQRVGQVNGLSIIEVADYEFGIPSRISAQTYMGRSGVVAIDREVNLAGNLHNKGLLTLQGYLGGKYARQKPLSLSASLTFEQNYDRIDGDSASCAELCALLSSLSSVPVRQDLAVTGSVDQEGRVQAIGGVVAKIEGFFDICLARGLTGQQGVIIPAANVRNLTLRSDVVQAVREGKFHVYAVDTIDQVLELLTGLPAGEPDAEGNYPPDSVHYRVQQRLLEMAEEKAGRDEEEEEETAEAAARADASDEDPLDDDGGDD